MLDRSLVKTLFVFEAAALSLLMMHLWFAAYTSGGSLTITVDRYGEARLEYVLWLVLTPILVLGLHYVVAD